MRVLAITNMYPPHHYGGYELSCQDVMRRFAARGHEVTVLTTTITRTGVPTPADERADGIRRDLRMYWADHALLDPPLRQRVRIERGNRARLAEAIDAARPDVVSVWNMGAMSLGLLGAVARRGIPMVLVVCDDWLAYGPHLDAWSRIWLPRARRPLGRAVAVLTGLPTRLPDLGALGPCCFVSETTRQRALASTPWTFPCTAVVYSGIDTDDFPVAGADEPVAPRAWRGRLLYVGRIDARKGIDTVIGALPHLPGATLLVLGAGDDDVLADLRSMVDRLALQGRVTFESLARNRLAAAYRTADAVMFPSTWEEPFGLVPLEAMACDTPVVATGRGGSGEFLADGVNCLTYPAGDEVALAAAVQRLAGDAGLRASLAGGGRTTAAALTADRLAGVLEEWHAAAAARFRDGVPADRRPIAT